MEITIKNKSNIIITKNVVLAGILFTTILIAANVSGAKFSSFRIFGMDLSYSVALLFYPLTYVISDILTEVYGFKTSRMIIWFGLICNVVFMLCILATIYIKPSDLYHDQSSYVLILSSSVRIFVASIISFFVGEFCNSMIVSRLKVMQAGKLMPLRFLISTIFGVTFGCAIFHEIAFYGTLPQSVVWQMAGVEFVIKIIYDVCCIPFTCLISGALKRSERIDQYDHDINYNPFKLS